MGKGGDEKSPGPAGGVDDFLSRPRVQDIDHHFDDVAGREELPFGTAQRGADEHLEGFPDGVPIRLHDGVVLKLADDMDKAVHIESDTVGPVEDVAEDVLLHPFEQRLDAGLHVSAGFADAGSEIHRVLGAGFLFVQQFAEEKVDDLLRQRLVARDAGGHARQVVPNVPEHRLQIGRANEILAFVQPDVLDPLPVPRNVRENLVGAPAVLVMNLAKVDVIFAIEPDAHLCGGHVHVQAKLLFAVLSVAALALHYHQKIVFPAPRAEHGDVHRKGPILIGWSGPHAVLGMSLHLFLVVAVVLDQTAGEDLNGVHLLGRRPHLSAADEVGDELAGRGAAGDGAIFLHFPLRHSSSASECEEFPRGA